MLDTLKDIQRKLAAAGGISAAAALVMFTATDAQAVPAFARQTGQNCVTCHAGGQFPELTPYGRMFKMTGYTIGTRTVPLSVMVNADFARVKNTSGDPAPQDTFAKNGGFAVGGGSLFLAGKLTDNIGFFVQDTYDRYGAKADDGHYIGHSEADYVDIRYADRIIDGDKDLVFGVSLNNRPTGTDPSSAVPAWMQYVPSTNGDTIGSRFAIDAAAPYPGSNPFSGNYEIGATAAGVNLYLFWNRMVYAELGAYRTPNRGFSFLSAGTRDEDTVKTSGTSPYWRLAFSHEWGAHSVWAGITGMVAKTFDGPDVSDPSTVARTRSSGADVQYQYLLDPHTVTAQLSFMRQNVDYSAATVAAGGQSSDKVDALRAKLSYIYQAKYGGALSYFGRSTTANPAAILDEPTFGNTTGNFGAAGVTYEAFYLPVQNVRVGLQYTAWNKFNGLRSNYDGYGHNASDNNTLYGYVWFAY